MAEEFLYSIEPLADHHDRMAFSCGVEALDTYFHRQAGQDARRGTAVVFVLAADNKTVAGFYTLSSLSLMGEDLPEKFAKKLPSSSSIGVTLLGRMAVSKDLKGQRLGEFLLMDALKRALQVSKEVASWALVVDAKEAVREFYLRYGFIALSSQTNRLFLPMKMVERLFGQ